MNPVGIQHDDECQKEQLQTQVIQTNIQTKERI